jgi:cell wall-associated NlpC family hydrolase
VPVPFLLSFIEEHNISSEFGLKIQYKNRAFEVESQPMISAKKPLSHSFSIAMFIASLFLNSHSFATETLPAPITQAGTSVSLPKLTEDIKPQSIFARYTNAAQDVILKGLELVGINYVWGGASADAGLDCSGYVQVVFKDAMGLVLPRTAKEMSEVGEKVDFSSLKPGDLVFFNTMRRAFSHVGIYMGDNYFLHAPRKGAEVRLESMQQSYWLQRYNGARRLIE